MVINGKIWNMLLPFIFFFFSSFFFSFFSKDTAIKSLHRYGVGSCGPRGFYGTIGKYG